MQFERTETILEKVGRVAGFVFSLAIFSTVVKIIWFGFDNWFLREGWFLAFCLSGVIFLAGLGVKKILS